MKQLTDDQLIFARRCYIRGVSAPNTARNLSMDPGEVDSLFDRFRNQGVLRTGHCQPMPVTLPKLRYLEGSNA